VQLLTGKHLRLLKELLDYNIELRDNGVGEWKLVATVPATQFKQQITKNDSTGWVSS